MLRNRHVCKDTEFIGMTQIYDRTFTMSEKVSTMPRTYLALVVYAIVIAAQARLPPTITTTLPTREMFRLDGEVILPCQATGSPKPEYEWYKDGALLYYTNNIRRSPINGDLTLTEMSSGNQGYYQCFAKNDNGVSISRIVYLAMAKYANTDNTDISLVGETGKPLQIECRRISLSVPAPQFSWSVSKDKVDEFPISLTTNKRMQITEDGHLYFTNVIQEDNLGGKFYKCNIRNSFLDMDQGGSYTNVTVTSNGPVQEVAPSRLHAPESPVIALVGRQLKLKCLFAGNPTPTVNWGRVDGHLPSGRYKTQQASTELVISDIKKEDEGVYKCWGSNSPLGVPKVSEDVRIVVDVQEIPTFVSMDKQPYNRNATEGDDVTFFCESEAEPVATVHWMINGQPIDMKIPGLRRFIGADRTTFTIQPVYKAGPSGQSDIMVVQCNASNMHDYVMASGYLNVLEQTKLVNWPADVTLEEDSSFARFNCSATGDSSTPVTLTWWKDGQRLYPDEDTRLTLEDSGSLFFDLQDMTLDKVNKIYSGKYECQATNGYEPIAKATARLSISGEIIPDAVVGASMGDLWWVFVIAAAVLLLIILLLCCCVCCQKNKGQSYPVDEKERLTGNDPEKELKENGFSDYQRPPEATPIKGSRISLLTATSEDEPEDEKWMDEYAGDFNPGNFEEDCSFIGQYEADSRKRASQKHTG